MNPITVKRVIEKVNQLLKEGDLFCPRVGYNDHGVENICLDQFHMSKFCKVLFFERKYTVSIGGVDVDFSNGEAKKVFNHTKKALLKYLAKEEDRSIEEYLK